MRHPQWLSEIEKNFDSVCKTLFGTLTKDEELTLTLNAERSTFIRINAARVRQNTFVEQAFVQLNLQDKTHSFKMRFPLTFNETQDAKRAESFLQEARERMSHSEPDPYIVPFENNGSSRNAHEGELLDDEKAFDALLTPAQGVDLAGIYASGPVVFANRNSKGQAHWFATDSFFVDYSLYNGARAVKGSYAGSKWNQNEYTRSIQEGKNQLALLSRPMQKINRGQYRTYLAPGAVAEMVNMLSWGAMSQSAVNRGSSAFKKLADGEKSLSPLFSLQENFKMGTTAPFNARGEVSPELLPLIEKGQLKQFLISSRTAKEYKGLIANGAAEGESLRAPEILTGSLSREDILRKLDTGLYLSNLHYLNWSDMLSARITGMTRYACFWVEKGEVVGPIQDLRFDESLYRVMGSELEAVTNFQEMQPDTMTYGERNLGGSLTPGFLVRDFRFTL